MKRTGRSPNYFKKSRKTDYCSFVKGGIAGVLTLATTTGLFGLCEGLAEISTPKDRVEEYQEIAPKIERDHSCVRVGMMAYGAGCLTGLLTIGAVASYFSSSKDNKEE